MAGHHHQFWDDRSGDVETRPTVDDLIRPGLLKAFPLRAQDQTHDDGFRRLLNALAQRSGGPS